LNNGKIEHIGIAVKDLKVSNLIFEKLVWHATTKVKKWSEGFRPRFKSGPNKIELWQLQAR
jgi:methylmalonyl-CoA/ethylmalonyl-CoA epimerase